MDSFKIIIKNLIKSGFLNCCCSIAPLSETLGVPSGPVTVNRYCMQSAQRNQFVCAPCASSTVNCAILPAADGKGCRQTWS